MSIERTIMQKDILLNAVEKAKPGLAKKENIQQSTSFAFMGDRIATFNDEISISVPVQGMENIIGAVFADNLYKLLKKIKGKEVVLETTESEIRIKSGKTTAGVTMESEIKLPIDAVGDIGEWLPVPDDFIASLDFSLFSVGTDSSKPLLTGIAIKETGEILSCDSDRITSVQMSSKMPIRDILVPGKIIKDLVGYDVTHVADGDGWIHFKTSEDIVFSCRVFEEPYPDVSSFFDIDGINVEFPKEIADMIEKASIFTEKESVTPEAIKVSIDDNNMIVESKGDNGWYKEEAELEVSYDDSLHFLVNSKFLGDIIGYQPKCVLSDSRVFFKDTKWKHVIALISEV